MIYSYFQFPEKVLTKSPRSETDVNVKTHQAAISCEASANKNLATTKSEQKLNPATGSNPAGKYVSPANEDVDVESQKGPSIRIQNIKKSILLPSEVLIPFTKWGQDEIVFSDSFFDIGTINNIEHLLRVNLAYSGVGVYLKIDLA